MHEKIKEVLEKSLNIIKLKLQETYPEEWESKYILVLQELTKVRKDETEELGFQYFQDVYESLKGIVPTLGRNTEWQNSTGLIGRLLDESYYLYKNDEILNEHSAIEADAVHDYLLGDAIREIHE